MGGWGGLCSFTVDCMKFKFTKRARMHSSLFAGCMFIALAVYGWDLPIETVLLFFAICVGFLLIIIACAALVGWLLKIVRTQKNNHEDDFL